jgi:uncharacterized protein (TIGR03118 family)
MGKFFRLPFKVLVFSFALSLLSTLAFGQHYTTTPLVSNIAGTATVTDSNLQNAWGLVASPGSPWWLTNNAGGTSTLYNGGGTIIPLVVTVPNAPSQQAPGSPTGIIFNGSPTDFLVAPGQRGIFIFVTEDGTISGWNPGVQPTTAVIVVDHSQVPNAKNGAVYKGATVVEVNGKRFLLATNFRSGRVDIFDSTFKQVRSTSSDNDDDSDDAFNDERTRLGFAPFNIQAVGPNVYVTYAKQDAARHDPVGGTGLGFVDVFDTHGRLLQRLQSGPWFNAPWGVVLTPGNFGEFSHAILVGQFRGGTIAAFNPVTGRFMGNVLNPDGTTFNSPGLWALQFGAGNANSGPATTLFFTAGPGGEVNGLFATLTPVAAELGEADEL